ARIVPQEDMPYMTDGTPVEIVLNPLGVPSRMNVGQILETHLGWAAKELGNSLKRLLSKEVKAEALRRWFREVFTETAVWKTLAKLSDDELLEYAEGFGEMEVWALEAYGAAHILQELLTAKSDDVYGRAKIYEAIVKGEPGIEPGVPESFNVLVRELQSLCLDVELMKRQKPPADKAA